MRKPRCGHIAPASSKVAEPTCLRNARVRTVISLPPGERLSCWTLIKRSESHSTRLFLPQPVPRELVNEALALDQYAPSNSNIQPWHMVFASGACRDRLVAALIDEAQRRPPNVPPLPASFQHFRHELGAQVYGAMGISREDTARHAAAVLRNWEFFRAPVAGIVCMHPDLGPADALSVGMFLQTLLLALTERGLR